MKEGRNSSLRSRVVLVDTQLTGRQAPGYVRLNIDLGLLYSRIRVERRTPKSTALSAN